MNCRNKRVGPSGFYLLLRISGLTSDDPISWTPSKCCFAVCQPLFWGKMKKETSISIVIYKTLWSLSSDSKGSKLYFCHVLRQCSEQDLLKWLCKIIISIIFCHRQNRCISVLNNKFLNGGKKDKEHMLTERVASFLLLYVSKYSCSSRTLNFSFSRSPQERSWK